MKNWLRARLRAWLGISDPVVAIDEKADPLKIAPSLFTQLLVKAGEHFVVPRKIEAPKLPENVWGGFQYATDNDPGKLGEPMLAFDDSTNAPAWAYLNQQNCGLGFPGYGYLAELSQRSEYRAPTETIASELTREWIDVTVKGKASEKKRKARGEAVEPSESGSSGLEDKIERLEALFEEFKIRDHFRRIAEVDGFFGRAQLSINMKNDTDESRQLPLVVDPTTIKKGSLNNFKVIEPIWTSPYSYNATDPTKPDFYKPRAWFVIGKRVHASRLLTFISREVPDILKPAYNFGGLSLSQLMEPYVFQWLRTRNSVSDLIHNFSVMVLKTDMAAVLSGDPSAGEGLLARAKLFTQTRDNQGLMLIDKNREEMQEIHSSLASLDKLQAQAQEHMAAPSHIPLVKLTGITPAGLNADSEGEIQVWYDWVRSLQISFFKPHLKHVFDILQLHEYGAIDDALSFEFVPLSSPTIKELSDIRKANAETDDKYVAMAAVSPEEVRERIAADPNSGFNNLSGPAPEPPDMGIMDKEHELGQAGAEADHARGKETAAQAHKRKLEEQAQAAKLKPNGASKKG